MRGKNEAMRLRFVRRIITRVAILLISMHARGCVPKNTGMRLCAQEEFALQPNQGLSCTQPHGIEVGYISLITESGGLLVKSEVRSFMCSQTQFCWPLSSRFSHLTEPHSPRESSLLYSHTVPERPRNRISIIYFA